jgi:hypothetical protein
MVNLGPLDDTCSLGDEYLFLNNWHDYFAAAHESEVKILARISYIVGAIHLNFGTKYKGDWELSNNESNCYECGCAEVDVYNYLSEIFTDNNLQYIEIDAFPRLNARIMIDNKIINLGEKFPKSWVFKDFEVELKSGKKAYADFLAQKALDKINKKSSKLNSKNEKVKLQETLKAKLTEEELQLISFRK